MKIINITLAAVMVIIAVAFGVNYYSWNQQTKRIDDFIFKLVQKLDEKDIKLTYDEITYIGHKAWNVEGEISNIKITSKLYPDPILQTNLVQFRSDLRNGLIEVTYDKEISFKIPTPTERLDYKVTFPNEPLTLKVHFDSKFSSIFNTSDTSDIDTFFKKVHTINISDGGFSLVDMVTNQELQKSGKEFIEISNDFTTDLKKFNVKFAYEDFMTYSFLKKEFVGPQAGKLDILIEGQVLNDKISSWKPEDLESYKINIKDFDFSNEVGKFQISGTLAGSKASFFMPSVSLTMIIGNYAALLDTVEKEFTALKNSSDPKVKAQTAAYEHLDFAKFKKYFEPYKINETDIKFEITGENPMDLMISGKPYLEVEKELMAILMPPSPPAAIETMPTQEGMELVPFEPSLTPAPLPEVQKEPLPLIPQQ